MNRGDMTPTHTYDKCQRPLTRIDFYAELLEGCIYCNVWKEVARAVWRKILEIYCFGKEDAKTMFMKDPKGNLAKAQTYYSSKHPM